LGWQFAEAVDDLFEQSVDLLAGFGGRQFFVKTTPKPQNPI
jgi:hypothetical protein